MMKLHGYFRSSASWRVRIALGLKNISVRNVPHHLRRGEQRDPAYLALKPQGLVPALELDDGAEITQSLAIILHLDALVPKPPLLPAHPLQRARRRSFYITYICIKTGRGGGGYIGPSATAAVLTFFLLRQTVQPQTSVSRHGKSETGGGGQC